MHKQRTLYAALALGLAMSAGGQDPSPRPFASGFYAFQNGIRCGSAEQDARALKELGYDGVSQVFDQGQKLSERVAAYEKVGLKVLSVYLDVYDKPIAAELVQPLENRGAMIELTVRKKAAGTVEAVRQTAEMAAGMNIRVALYPHHGFAVATMPEAMELMAEVDHPNLGVMFNLCHFLRNEDAETLEKVIEAAGARLFAVSTAGADLDGRDWGRLIQPLDQGDFPQERLLKALKNVNFKGPVGLQCFGVKGDKLTNLERSMAAWKKIIQAL